MADEVVVVVEVLEEVDADTVEADTLRAEAIVVGTVAVDEDMRRTESVPCRLKG